MSAAGRAGNAVANAGIAAEHGVLAATGDAQNAVNRTLGESNTNVNAAGQNVNTATTAANGNLQGLLDSFNQSQQPYQAAGAQGASSLASYAASNPQFNFNPTQQQLEQTPGYQFQLQQGKDAIQNTASASGLGQSGSTLAALTQYGQGLAGTYYQNAFNNAQSSFNTNQNATLSNLSALIGTGQNAQGQSLSAAQTLGGQQSQNTIGAANTNASLQQYLASLNLQGQTTAGNQGIQGSTIAGNFATGAAEGTAAGILGSDKALAGLGGDVASLSNLIPGLGPVASKAIGLAV